MLVVLAGLVLLLALLLPPLSRNRAEVRKIQCLFNLRQVALVLKLYIADHDQQFPWNYDGLAGQRLMPN